ncbi:MAG: hypothetical protein JSU91_01780 [Thermoplasmatales archaeon]|nr:MAG: hypothetical protein JSU91_01780 [Thermoplasmatales archaeon]
MIKILCHYPSATDASSYYRGIGVMSNLYRIDETISHEMTSIVHWSVLKGSDILFMQRPFLNDHVHAIEMAKECNVKVWIDYDDLLTNIPSCNPFLKQVKKSHNLSKENIKINVVKCLTLSDKITVSTEHLKVKLSEFVAADKIVVIPNAHDDYFMPINNMKIDSNREKVIFWRGSESHKNDIYAFEDEIKKAMNDNPEFKFVFMGYNPKIFLGHKNFIHLDPTNNIMKYFKILDSIKPSITIIPLEENDFNRSKSNIAALESIYYNSLPVTNLKHEWDKLSFITNKNNFSNDISVLINGDYSDTTKNIIKNGLPIDNLLTNYRHNFKKKFLLSEVNKKRIEIAKQLGGIYE